MDHNHDSTWPDANFTAESQEWLPDTGNCDNSLLSRPIGSNIGSSASLPTQPRQEIIVREVRARAIAIRYAYWFVLALGVVLSLLAVVISTRVLPRYANVQQRYGFQLPVETTLALRSGMVQPIPGCAVILAGLTGLLARSPSRRHALVTAILLLAALALPMATGAALLIPELTLV